MSHQASSWALEQNCETATEKAVLMIVASYAGPDGTCFPGQDTIARQACCSVKSVERALKVFEGRGWISREARRRGDGSRTSDLIAMLCAPNPEQQDTVSDRGGPTRHPVQTNPTPCPNQPDTLSGLTTFEPARRNHKTEQASEPLAETLWQTATPPSRERSGRPATRRAVDAAIAKGATPEALIASVRQHCRVGGDHAKGLHRIVEAELWREHLAKPRSTADPGLLADRCRHHAKTGEWRDEWGERPKQAA